MKKAQGGCHVSSLRTDEPARKTGRQGVINARRKLRCVRHGDEEGSGRLPCVIPEDRQAGQEDRQAEVHQR